MTCGEGEEIRQVACFLPGILRGEDSKCDPNNKPESVRKCHRADCPGTRYISGGGANWRTGPWSGVCTIERGIYWRTLPWSGVHRIKRSIYLRTRPWSEVRTIERVYTGELDLGLEYIQLSS